MSASLLNSGAASKLAKTNASMPPRYLMTRILADNDPHL